MRLIAFLVFATVWAGHAVAGPASERLFAADVLATVGQSGEVGYAHERTVPEDTGVRSVQNGTVLVVVGAGDDGALEAKVKMGEADKLRVTGVFPVSSGNPLLPILLESSLRAMANATGGSPFYIRNRMKDALGVADGVSDTVAMIDGREVPAQEIVIQPFQNDAKRDRMGDFADMTLRFVMTPEARGGFVLFSAETPASADGTQTYAERIQLDGAEVGG